MSTTRRYILPLMFILACLTGQGKAWAQQEDLTAANGAQAGSSGHGVKHTARHVVSSRDVSRISYPQSDTSTFATKDGKGSDSASRARSLLLIRPRHFDREGVYIWRDADGIWQVQAVSNAELAVTGRIVAEKTIVPQPINGVASSRIEIEGLSPSIATIRVHGATAELANPLQFKAEGAYVDFDLQIDGKNDSSRIYIGLGGLRPAAIPLRLENRPIEIPKPSASAQAKDSPSARPSQATVKTGPDGKPQASSGGGSDGGAGGRTKSRK